MSRLICVVVIVLVVFLGGCSTKQAPDFARLQPEMGVSVQMPSSGIITIIPGILPAEFLVEVHHGVKGVWPIVGGHQKDEKAQIVNGFCFSLESQSFEKNVWGIVAPIKCVLTGTRGELKDYRFAIVNKDGGVWITSPIGGEMLDDKKWDFRKFEKDHKYRNQILDRVGLTLDEVNGFWQERFGEMKIAVKGGAVQEISIVDGNPAWQDFQKEFIREMGYELDMPDGTTVVSHLSGEEMQKLLAKNPHITGWQRFLSRLAVPIGTPEVMLFGTATSVLQGGIAALIEDDWKVRVARGTVQLKDTSDQVVFLTEKIQAMHERAVRAEMRRKP